MLYIKMIANALNINMVQASNLFDMMEMPYGFSNSTEEEIIEEAKIAMMVFSDKIGIQPLDNLPYKYYISRVTREVILYVCSKISSCPPSR